MSFPYSINTYKCVKKPTVVSTLSIDNWFDQIKQSDYSEQIIKARHGQLDYEATKKSLPCVTYNFLFNGYKTDANASSSTGLMYIDIDHPSFDISTIDPKKVYSYYKSFGGSGYAIIVKVLDLTLENFKASYLNITNDLGITDYIDIQAIKPSQFNVLSYDKDIFINTDSFIYASAATPPIVYREREKAYTVDGRAEFKQLRFDNLNEINIEDDYIVNWEGYLYIKCFLPIKKVKNNRNNFLLSYCNNLVYLNPNITLKKTIQILRAVNLKACEKPVDEKHLLRVANSIHKYNQAGTLNPIYFNKLRKIVFSSSCKLTRDEKLEICRVELAEKRTQGSKDKIYDIIEGWDFKRLGSITQRKVYRHNPISKKTVEKYWNDFKTTIELINQRHKLEQQLFGYV